MKPRRSRSRSLTAALAVACACALAAAAPPAHAKAIRPAPNFTWLGPAHRSSLRAVSGQPVVLLIARSARSGAFKKQVKNLREIYQQFAARGVVFAVAVREGEPTVRSNIPFAVAADPAGVAAAYGCGDGKFALAVIGKDGNLDYQTGKPQTAQRLRDVIQNSFAVQAAGRR